MQGLLPRRHRLALPVDDRRQIHEAARQAHVGDVDGLFANDKFCLVCTARLPVDAEKNALLNSLTRLRAQYAQEPEAAKKLIATGESKPDPQLNPIDLAAHTALASLLLNLDETLSKE